VEAKFRKKLVLFEIVLTVIFFIIATSLMAKSMSADFNTSIFKKALRLCSLKNIDVGVADAPQILSCRLRNIAGYVTEKKEKK